jgi:hypothetical protein
MVFVDTEQKIKKSGKNLRVKMSAFYISLFNTQRNRFCRDSRPQVGLDRDYDATQEDVALESQVHNLRYCNPQFIHDQTQYLLSLESADDEVNHENSNHIYGNGDVSVIAGANDKPVSSSSNNHRRQNSLKRTYDLLYEQETMHRYLLHLFAKQKKSYIQFLNDIVGSMETARMNMVKYLQVEKSNNYFITPEVSASIDSTVHELLQLSHANMPLSQQIDRLVELWAQINQQLFQHNLTASSADKEELRQLINQSLLSLRFLPRYNKRNNSIEYWNAAQGSWDTATFQYPDESGSLRAKFGELLRFQNGFSNRGERIAYNRNLLQKYQERYPEIPIWYVVDQILSDPQSLSTILY